MPSFLINGLYAPLQYDQLPGLFGIEAVVASDRSNVTLHVNGSTQLAHNVTVECRNIIDAVTGDSESMFHLTLQFVGKFIKTVVYYCILCHNNTQYLQFYGFIFLHLFCHQMLFQHRVMYSIVPMMVFFVGAPQALSQHWRTAT